MDMLDAVPITASMPQWGQSAVFLAVHPGRDLCRRKRAETVEASTPGAFQDLRSVLRCEAVRFFNIHHDNVQCVFRSCRMWRM